MSLFYVLIAVLPIAALTALFAYSFNRKSRGVSGKKVLARNLIAFAVIAITVCAVTFSVSAANEDKTNETATTSQSEEATSTASNSDNGKGLGLLAAAEVYEFIIFDLIAESLYLGFKLCVIRPENNNCVVTDCSRDI